MSRPINRLPTKRPGNEPKELMNCKNCRKRKIKCDRLKPKCEACLVFKCPCIYDAVPKKRGPKTDVLESLLKRVNGLEQRMKDEKKPELSDLLNSSGASSSSVPPQSAHHSSTSPTPPRVSPATAPTELPRPVPLEPSIFPSSPTAHIDLTPEAVLDTYFSRLHEKPYYVLDEAATRSRLAKGRLPRFLLHAIYAVSIKFAAPGNQGYNAVVKASHNYAVKSRSEIDVDEPSVDHLQALLLLSLANFQIGKGRKSHMVLSHAITMGFALDLHCELPQHLRIPQIEREGRRKLFWTCYLMDRFSVVGSKRPPLIADETVSLRLPAWRTPRARIWADGNFFRNSTSVSHGSGFSSASEGSGATLVEITRILGITTRYLSLGGIKADSHFPWHPDSTLSKIRAELDIWAAGTQEAFVSLETLFVQTDSSLFLLSKLIYHLVHCLIYRPLLPVTLADLSGSNMHQSWQIEATKLVFAHANAIVELVQCAKNAGVTDCAPLVGFCLYTAGTVHVHGLHYGDRSDGHVFGNSEECLSREMAHLEELRFTWAGVDSLRESLRTVHAAHSQLLQAVTDGTVKLASVFQLEHFVDRYPGVDINEAHVQFVDITTDFAHQHNTVSHRPSILTNQSSWPKFSPDNSAFNHSPTFPLDHSNLAFPYPEQSPPIFDPSHRNDTTFSTTFTADGSRKYSQSSTVRLPTPMQPMCAASPTFAFSPLSPEAPETMDLGDGRHDSMCTLAGGGSGEEDRVGSGGNGGDDPFLALLEELAASESHDDSGRLGGGGGDGVHSQSHDQSRHDGEYYFWDEGDGLTTQ